MANFKYFKDDSDALFQFRADGTQDHMIKGTLTPITEAEKTAMLTASAVTAKTPRQVLNDTLESLVYEIDATRTIQVRPQDSDFITGEIDDLEAGVITSSTWIMLDNLPHPITLTELKAAKLSGRAQVRAAYTTYGATL